MDRIKNPFSPGTGAPPPELVGRDPILEEAAILLGRIQRKRPEKKHASYGASGVGKTVLLTDTAKALNDPAQAEGVILNLLL